MDFAQGKSALLQVLAMMNDEGQLAMKISSIMDSIAADKSRSVSQLCEVLVLQKDEMERKEKCVKLLEEVAHWWQLLVADREKMLVTIATLELEKDAILKKYTDPVQIYGHLEKKRPRLTSQSQLVNGKSQADVVEDQEDDFMNFK